MTRFREVIPPVVTSFSVGGMKSIKRLKIAANITYPPLLSRVTAVQKFTKIPCPLNQDGVTNRKKGHHTGKFFPLVNKQPCALSTCTSYKVQVRKTEVMNFYQQNLNEKRWVQTTLSDMENGYVPFPS